MKLWGFISHESVTCTINIFLTYVIFFLYSHYLSKCFRRTRNTALPSFMYIFRFLKLILLLFGKYFTSFCMAWSVRIIIYIWTVLTEPVTWFLSIVQQRQKKIFLFGNAVYFCYKWKHIANFYYFDFYVSKKRTRKFILYFVQ